MTTFHGPLFVLLSLQALALHSESKPLPPVMKAPEVATLAAHLDAGWYPSDARALEIMVHNLEKKSSRLSAHLDPNQIRALVVPHAGLNYSGVVAAATYKTIEGAQCSRVIILAPSHYKSFNGVALPTMSRYRMPQGDVVMDTAILQQLAHNPLFMFDDAVFQQEHAIEIQLPFVQHYMKDISVVPLIIGDLTMEQISVVAKTIARFVDKQTLVIVSTDFTHYGKQFTYTPFADHVAERIQQLDARVINSVQAQKVEPFLDLIKTTGATVCGRMPLAVFLSLCQQQVFGSLESRLVAYETSADAGVTGSSVSYVGLVFTTQKRATQPLVDQFTPMEQRAFLALSQGALASLYDRSKADFLLPLLSNAGDEKRGVFVTLYKKNNHDHSGDGAGAQSVGDLRGCIGIVEPTMPLSQGIMNMTEAATLRDTRFKPVTVDELPAITLELSLLSVPTKIGSYRTIQLGKQGIILKQGDKQALFLPKVAVEFGWDLPTTLTQLSQKAGLPALAWKDPKTEFHVFTSLDIK